MSSSSPSIEALIRDGRALQEKATCEGWVAQGCDVRRYYMHFDHRMAYASTPDNASFIAWSRNNLPALLDALEAAQSDLRSLETEGSAKQRIRFAQENDALRAENERLRAHFDNCQADKIVTLVLERDALRAELLAARTALDKMAPIELKMLGEQTTDRIAAWRAARGEEK
jgi:hypothetical protein